MGEWRPSRCPKDDGVMQPIPGFDDAWKCAACGLEFWDGDVPTAEEYEDLVSGRMTLLSVTQQRPFISRSYVEGTAKGGSTKPGRKRKKQRKPDLQNRYRNIMSDKSGEG